MDADACTSAPAAKIGVASRAMIDPRDFFRLLGRLPDQQDCEFVPASAGTAGRLRCGFLQDLGHAPQQLIAREVAVQVIDPLEMVEIDEEQRPAFLASRASRIERNNSLRFDSPVATSMLALRWASRSAFS